MISLERYNKQNNRYIYRIKWISGVNCGYSVSGCIGTQFYMMYTLKEVVRKYNTEAKSMKKRVKY